MDKLTNFRKTLNELKSYVAIPILTNRDRAGVIQAFEFTYEQYGLPVTKGSVNNFNILAAQKLRDWDFKAWLDSQLLASSVLHADETGTNINGVRNWIHCLCNESLTYFHVDQKRGGEAMERMGVLESFKGQLVHDHWKPYFLYLCTHVLCNAHHLRELERAFEQDAQKWAKRMKKLLEEINLKVNEAGGKLSKTC